ncbi:MAG TPA: tetratricopeptide repeat protein [Acidobacteriota bacterium]|nr:tetratricopeptide repeat protein [Acidobacteriota bacterium]
MARRGVGTWFPTPSGTAARVWLAAGTAALTLALLLVPASPAGAAWTGEEIQRALEAKWDGGVSRDLPSAQGCYRAALAASDRGDRAEAVRLLEASTQFDPLFPDAHFTLARLLAFQEPGRAVAEANEAFRILARGYAWQRHLLANLLTGVAVVWMVGLLLAVAGIAIRHLPHLTHILRESLGAGASAAGRIGSAAIALAPCAWGLGAVPTAGLYAGLLSFRLGKREWFLVILFLVSSIALAGGMQVLAPWAGPPRLEEPSLLVDRALNAGYDHDLSASLVAWQETDPNEVLYPFALGTQARRGGDLELAERELTRASVLKPRTAWILTNLGNVHFAREDYDRARQSYEAAAALAPSTVEPHYNLAQVYTKQLLFSEATREQATASGLAFDRVRDFSRVSAPQLNRTVMDAAVPVEELWGLARRHASERGLAALDGNPYLSFVASLQPSAPFALVFLPALFLLFGALGQVVGRSLATLPCSNCQRVVCRRCVFRMQQRAFCADCFHSVKDLKSTEFTRLLLSRRDRSSARRRTWGQAIVTFVLPGAGQMLRGATLSGFLAILIMTAAALIVIPNGALVRSLDVLPIPASGWAKRAPLLVLFLLTYAISVARYFTATTAQETGLTGRAGRRESTAAEPRARSRQG